LVFYEQTYLHLWDEPVLSQLNWLFQVKPPELSIFGGQVVELRQRCEHVQRMNDFFFRILDPDSSVETVYEALVAFYPVEPSLLDHLRSSGRLETIRDADDPPSEKVFAFLIFLREDVGLDLTNQEPVTRCLEALKVREGAGVVNALLVRARSVGAVVIPLQIKVQPGSGQVHPVVRGHQDFEDTLKRARLALVDRGFLTESDDVVCTLELTEPEYSETSIGLAAAVGMYGAARGIVIDPYTAFTGDINLDKGGHWQVKGVSGLPQKIEAARRSGCRRVFIPRENLKEVGSIGQETLRVFPVDNLIGVFLQLQAPLQPLPGDSVQVRKINALKAFCQAQGWDLSPSRPVQDGLQFRVVPLLLPELAVNIYHTGAHAPRQHHRQEYQELLGDLQAQEDSGVPIRKVEKKFNIPDASLRVEIREALERLRPEEQRQEPYCGYVFKFDRGQERLVVKQYQKGTLQIQGTAGGLYKAILECIIPRYNLRHPKADLSVETLLQPEGPIQGTAAAASIPPLRVHEIPLPYIGTDESGKGDYFGPMVVAAVMVDALIKPKLEALGVKDSKLLSDKRCRELAAHIREIARGKYEEVEIPPDRYNELYESFKREGKNLNHLLAWGHARAIESLLERFSCTHAVADQFGDERYILSRLMEKGKQLKLVQLPKGERYLGVATASVLARDKFLARLDEFSQEYGMELPKGASEAVVTAAKRLIEMKGPSELRRAAKLHHKTTAKVMGKGVD
jgi:ribonuclease HIII